MGAVNKMRLLVIALVLGAGAYGAVELWNSSVFELETVEVAGNDKAAKDEIVDAAGVRAGAHLFSLSIDRIAERVGGLAWVDTVQVERIVPSRLRITITEREAVAAITLAGRSWIVDHEGVVLEEVVKPEEGSPLISDLEVEVPEVGERVSEATLVDAVRIARDLPAELREQLVSISAPKLDRIALHLKGGLVVLYGPHESVEEKNFATIALMERASEEGRRLERIDVRVPGRPATKP